MVKRSEVIIYYNYRASLIQQFKDLGASIEYTNKKAGYSIAYIDLDNQENFLNQIKHLKGFKRYELSPTELVELDI